MFETSPLKHYVKRSAIIHIILVDSNEVIGEQYLAHIIPSSFLYTLTKRKEL